MTNKLLLLLVVGLLAISCTKTSKEVDFVDSLFTNANYFLQMKFFGQMMGQYITMTKNM